jgi:NADH-quinone oxidoreductase subunit L
MVESKLIALIPALPLLGALVNLLIGRSMSRRFVHAVAVASVAASCAVALYLVARPLWQAYAAWHGAGEEARAEVMAGLHQNLYTWIEVGTLKLDLAFRLDTLSAVMILVVTFVGTLIHIYSTGYMADEPRYAAYFGYLNLFTGSMLILVLGDNLPVMFIGWEGVGVCSYLLIGFWFTNPAYADAGRKAFVVNRIGDFAFLLGMFLLFWATGSMSFGDLQSAGAVTAYKTGFMDAERLAMFAGMLLFIGACGKSAQIPLYVWLPDAMAGPTPVSALIHAATMVTAGVYMVARMSFLYAHSTTAMAIVAGVGALTALFAAIMAFAQTDLKKVLAYSTVSQLGFMFVGVGVGAYTAGIFHLVTHAFFKAGLFLAAGSVMHAMSGSGDITRMGALRKRLPLTHISFLIYCLAIAGIPIFSGFFSKDEILAGAFGVHAEGWVVGYGKALWAILSLAALGTAFYMFRLYFLVFAGDECRADAETQAHIHESPASMTGPLLILAAFTCVIGFIGLPHLSFLHGVAPNLLHEWLDASLVDFGRASLDGSIHEAHFSDVALIALMAIATAMGALGIAGAYALYGKGRPSPLVERFVATPLGATLYDLSLHKFYVDEIYQAAIVRPFRWLAEALFRVVDQFLIDLVIVNGSAFLVDLGSRVMRWFQNGQVQRYLVGVVIGGALLFWFTSRPSPAVEWKQLGDLSVQAVVDPSAGIGSNGAKVEIDFDGDGSVDRVGEWSDRNPIALAWTYSRPGAHEVTLWMTDPVFKKRTESRHTIEVAPAAAKVGEGEVHP